MPAISADTMVLPRIPTVDPIAADRLVLSVTTAPSGLEGEGFPVRRAFAGVDLRALDPFVHMDQMGEVDYAPGEPRGTPWHPHRGFETATYMIDGIFQHQDFNLSPPGRLSCARLGDYLLCGDQVDSAICHMWPAERACSIARS